MRHRIRNFRHALLQKQYGKLGYIVAWALGVPIPILLLVFFLRGCN